MKIYSALAGLGHAVAERHRSATYETEHDTTANQFHDADVRTRRDV